MVRKHVAKHSSGLLDFVREQGVIGLAVGLAVGTAAASTVKVIVDEFISPLVALITQGVDLNGLKWVIMNAGQENEVAIGWGAILSSVIILLATIFIIYWILHAMKLDRLDKKKE